MLDRTTVMGLIVTLALVAWVLMAGAGWEISGFWQTRSLALVIGGAVVTTLMSVPAGRLRELVRLVRGTLSARGVVLGDLVVLLVALAEIARRDGLLALEKPVGGLSDGFLRRGMRMAIDGADPATIERICRAEMETLDLRHTYGVRLFESMARAAPVFGMMGTLIGLVVMLGRLSDPSRIGPGMAVALLTTLYGLVLAHVFCWPLARKLAHRSSEELLERMIALQGVLAIQAGDNPRMVEQKLRAYLPDDVVGGAGFDGVTVTGQVRQSLAETRRRAGTEPRMSEAVRAQMEQRENQPAAEATEWQRVLASDTVMETSLSPVEGSGPATESKARRPARGGFEEAA